jgi:hypothetical protein
MVVNIASLLSTVTFVTGTAARVRGVSADCAGGDVCALTTPVPSDIAKQLGSKIWQQNFVISGARLLQRPTLQQRFAVRSRTVSLQHRATSCQHTRRFLIRQGSLTDIRKQIRPTLPWLQSICLRGEFPFSL